MSRHLAETRYCKCLGYSYVTYRYTVSLRHPDSVRDWISDDPVCLLSRPVSSATQSSSISRSQNLTSFSHIFVFRLICCLARK